MKRLIFVLLFACQVQAVEIVRYVDTGSDAAGDGTTNATSSGDNTHAYQSLAAWEAAEQQNLTDGGGDTMTVHCNRTNGGGLDTTQCTVNGWTTSAEFAPTITADDFPADGVFDNTKYVLAGTNDVQGILFVAAHGHLYLRKLQVQETITTTGSAIEIDFTPADNILVLDSCIIKGVCSGAGGGIGLFIDDTDVHLLVYNTVIYGFASGADIDFYGIRGDPGAGSLVVYNSTIYGNGHGINSGAGPRTAKNCVVVNNNDDFFGVLTTMDYIVSDDDHSGDCANYWSLPTAGVDNYTLDFTTPGSDFSLLATATDLIDKGVADLFDEDDDIIDVARPQGVAWDIGAYESTAAPPSTASQIID